MRSDGQIEENPRQLKRHLKQFKRLQQSVSRKENGSQNHKIAVQHLARQHRTVANLRASPLHQLTSRLAKTKSVVVIEHLHVADMLKHHRLAQAIGDVGFGELRRQLEYRAHWHAANLS